MKGRYGPWQGVCDGRRKWIWKAGVLRHTLQELPSVQQSKKSEDWASGWSHLTHLYWYQIHQPIHQKTAEKPAEEGGLNWRRRWRVEEVIRAKWRCNGADRSLNGAHPLVVLVSWTCGTLILVSEEPQQPDLKESASLLCPLLWLSALHTWKGRWRDQHFSVYPLNDIILFP